jgi:hypothetical protein
MIEEHTREPVVVVLPGMDEPRLEARAGGEGADDGSDLDKVRPGADDA